MSPHPEDGPDQGEQFLHLLAQHERWLAAYVYSLVGDRADADDVLQECKVVLWRQFSRFVPGTNFCAWARTIAFHLVLNHRRAARRRPFTPHDQAFLEAVAAEIDRRGDEFERRTEALRSCLRKLPAVHRALVLWRYFDERGIDDIAGATRRSPEAVYRTLSRIRQVLNTCIQRELTKPSAS